MLYGATCSTPRLKLTIQRIAHRCSQEFHGHSTASALFAVASTLHPRFKILWADNEQSAIAKATVIRKMNALHPQSAINNTRDTIPPPSKRSRLLSFMASSRAPAANQDDLSSTELADYLAPPPLPYDFETLGLLEATPGTVSNSGSTSTALPNRSG